MPDNVGMRKMMLSSAPFYAGAVIIGAYISSGMPAQYVAMDITVTVFATFMSRRRNRGERTTTPRLSIVNLDPQQTLAFHRAVEESLVRAS